MYVNINTQFVVQDAECLTSAQFILFHHIDTRVCVGGASSGWHTPFGISPNEDLQTTILLPKIDISRVDTK